MKRNVVSIGTVIISLAVIVSAASAVQPGFDPKDVVRQVRGTQRAAPDLQPKAFDEGEFLIDTSGTHRELFPAAAFDGTNFLVVWQDYRNGVTADIYGARVTPAGVVLDPSGIAISTAEGNQNSAAVAFDGTNFLVVWQDYRNGVTADIYGARVTPTGVVLDTIGFAISTGTSEGYDPTLTFDGNNFLVVWTSGGGPWNSDIYGARVTPAGVVLDTVSIPISTAAFFQSSAALAFDSENYLVVWEDYRSGTSYDIYGARVTPAGMVLDTAGIAISTAEDWQRYPIPAFDGTNFIVVWQDNLNGGTSDIYGARVTPAGVVLDPSGIAISTAANYQYAPSVCFDGTDFLVVWEDRRNWPDTSDIYGARVSSGGVVFDSGPVVRQEGNQVYPALARGTGDQLFLVFQGWTGTVGNKTYNTDRIWGKMNPSTAIAEMTKPEARMTNKGATIIRGVLMLTPSTSDKSQVTSQLINICGRKVMDLHSGANDIRHLAPGVYFIRSKNNNQVTKIIVTR